MTAPLLKLSCSSKPSCWIRRIHKRALLPRRGGCEADRRSQRRPIRSAPLRKHALQVVQLPSSDQDQFAARTQQSIEGCESVRIDLPLECQGAVIVGG